MCLPDVRGTGETAPDFRRGTSSGEVSLAAAELMLGNTLLGARLKDLRSVLAYIESRPDVDRAHIALWGETLVPPNPARMLLDELPNWQIGPQTQQQAEPLGGLLALLGALIKPTQGKVLLDGTDLWARPEAELAAIRCRHIGFVFQFPEPAAEPDRHRQRRRSGTARPHNGSSASPSAGS